MENIEVVEEINEGNLTLRKITLDDAFFMFESLKERELIKFLSLGPLRDMGHSKKLIRSYLNYWEQYLQYNYIIEIQENNSVKKAGSISLWNISWLHKRSEIGIWINLNFWNQGIGTRAINLIQNIAFLHLQLNRLEAHISTRNERSISLFKNCDFKEEGTLARFLCFRGTFHDAKILASLNNSIK